MFTFGDRVVRTNTFGVPSCCKQQPLAASCCILRIGAALLLSDLVVLCEAALAQVVDADNADALEAEAERAFAPRLRAACLRAKRS